MLTGSPQVKELKRRQMELHELLQDPTNTPMRIQQLKILYDNTVYELTDLLGTHAHCREVDYSLWVEFVTWYTHSKNEDPAKHFLRRDVLSVLTAMSA